VDVGCGAGRSAVGTPPAGVGGLTSGGPRTGEPPETGEEGGAGERRPFGMVGDFVAEATSKSGPRVLGANDHQAPARLARPLAGKDVPCRRVRVAA
jgi:hypothetical protein